MPLQTRSRAFWVDGMRAICVLFVFFVHDGLPGGPALTVMGLACAVPAFFFISGVFASRSCTLSPGVYALRRAKQLLLPCWGFGLLTLVVCALLNPELRSQLPAEILRLFLGRRNHLFAAALWFFPCLWGICVLYRMLFARIPHPLARLAAAACVSLAARWLWEEPIAVFSFNLSLRYLFYYVLGDVLAPWLLETCPDNSHKAIRLGCGILGLAGCCVLFLAGPDLLRGPVPGQVWSAILAGVPAALAGIAGFALLGALLGTLPPVAFAGKNSLLYCCTEALAHPLLARLLALFGIGFHPGSITGRIVADLILMAFITIVFVLPVRLIKRYTPSPQH